ncbi:MAG: deoxynucleoside kinase [Candidatus Hydrogenedentota bacterium]
MEINADRITHNYIVVEGPIGVGKSDLVKLIAERYRGKQILEKSYDNPFLLKFYENKSLYAFQTQIFFLLSRYNQLKNELYLDLFTDFIISDFMILKDFLFASINLSEQEFCLYRQLFNLIQKENVKPDVVVYLYCGAEKLYDKIKNIDTAKLVSRDYLEKVCKVYNDFFLRYDETPLLVVNTEYIDFIKEPEYVYKLVQELENTRGGRRYYNPVIMP